MTLHPHQLVLPLVAVITALSCHSERPNSEGAVAPRAASSVAPAQSEQSAPPEPAPPASATASEETSPPPAPSQTASACPPASPEQGKRLRHWALLEAERFGRVDSRPTRSFRVGPVVSNGFREIGRTVATVESAFPGVEECVTAAKKKHQRTRGAFRVHMQVDRCGNVQTISAEDADQTLFPHSRRPSRPFVDCVVDTYRNVAFDAIEQDNVDVIWRDFAFP